MPSTTVVRASTRRVRLAVVLTGLVALMVTMVRPLRTPHRVPAVAAPPAEEPAPEDPAEEEPAAEDTGSDLAGVLEWLLTQLSNLMAGFSL
jgi:hypothetical protein